ncbi:PREDICTED: TATA box-binding protein-associated factor RNA polymerase I subunit D isoform X1 [Calidris pugnax]|uniref:TATA box-binding protein-associated factor RNA polymerase I subunit D isoform X1 n=1 Tax=Calidris pugnax TaxID=198806 RepID=UPI00071E2F57|nr:PREDICTED: TATA box-binding protein-associated factor RNA polymerase I subunit D isoform X1 [Calidris pugnax]XP_014813830.1 PREDICTED: TATA box-binding protein-associated factor RNA polymerase I subunit D isoform X1 [Calidris pugnax]XP_014813832.1 PREDICTED: TATA box-binding protein-associated factor RNA polymerase I subunit D isoform X1 [Calidris pugnax]XP_014813833.1 PREDICTED: TATA box-binding protein-associated factor RNA polymerase I subunit D isoform X1 [Calidris pugnax]XP_014813834.1 
MTDTDESQSSDSDDSDARELMCSQQKEPYNEVHAHEKNTRVECSLSRQKNGAPEESSDELNSTYKSSDGILLDSSDSENDVSAASGSEYHPRCSIAPSKEKRSESSEQQAESVAGACDNQSSSDSSLSPPSPVKSSETSTKKSKFNLKAIFAYHFRGKKFKAAAHRKYKCGSGKKKRRKYVSTQMPTGRPPLTASPQERKRRLLHRGFQFPFVEKYYGKKHIPLKMVLGYEQAAAKGYFQYIEMLKYEEHLRKALKALQASEDLERECLVVRKHKYLDDEGPISPIQETNDDDDSLNSDNPGDFDARVVENSSFIISSKIPSKKKSKPERKHAKSVEVIEIEEDDSASENSVILQSSPQ